MDNEGATVPIGFQAEQARGEGARTKLGKENVTTDKQQQQQELACRPRKPVDYGRRTEINREKEATDHNNNSGTNPNSRSSFLKKPHLHRGGGSRGRLARPGFEPRTNEKLNTIYAGSPNLSSRRLVNEKKLVNWRLACFLSYEYLSRGTLLGSLWPPQDSNSKSKPMSGSPDENADEIRREKERLYATVTGFLRDGDVHLPGIMNPSQLASWLGL